MRQHQPQTTKQAPPLFKTTTPKVLKDPTSYKVPPKKPLDKKVKFEEPKV